MEKRNSKLEEKRKLQRNGDRLGGIKVVVRLILNDISFLSEREETEGGKNEGGMGIAKILETLDEDLYRGEAECGSLLDTLWLSEKRSSTSRTRLSGGIEALWTRNHMQAPL